MNTQQQQQQLKFEKDHRIDYDEFGQLITTNPKLLGILSSARLLAPPDLDAISSSLIKLSNAMGSTTIMLNILLSFEFDKAYSSESQSVILRGNSLTTKAMDQFIQLYAIDYLKRVLIEPLKRVLMDESLSLEVDRTKLMTVESESDKDRHVEQNLDLLKQHTADFLDAIFSNSTLEQMPHEMRSACRQIHHLAQEYKFESVPLIGSFIMLRLFNPSIVFPEARRLLPSSVVVDPRKRRNLTLITKIIQNISNQVDFGAKEAYMIPLNAFIEKYKSKSEQFLLSTCLDQNLVKSYQEEASRNVVRARELKIVTSDPSLKREIENIHNILSKNKTRIINCLNELQPTNELSTQFEDVLKRLPPIAPRDKPLPPVPRQATAAATTGSASALLDEAPSDETLDSDRYKHLLEKAMAINDVDLEAMNILTIRGTDKDGRPIVVFTEERVKKEDLERVLLYIVKKLDRVVEKDYVMIWCVNNSSNQNRPGFNWLLNVYRSLSRKYKKNLKSFYLIHPTFMFKFIIKCFRPFVSDKFWKKLHLCDRVSQVYADIDKDTLPLPPSILTYDFLLNKDNTSEMSPVFGVPLDEIMNRPENRGLKVPDFLRLLMDHIRQHGMSCQGLFRVPGNVTEVNKVKILLNNNDNVDLTHCEIHTVATILKQFFREMPEPLFPFELYQDFISILASVPRVDNAITNHSFVEPVKELFNKFPQANLLLAKELFSLLVQINLNSEENKMNSHNLAIVFGPNILRSRSDNALSALQDNAHITKIIDFIIQEYTNLFMTQSMSRRNRPTNVRLSSAVFMEQFIHDNNTH